MTHLCAFWTWGLRWVTLMLGATWTTQMLPFNLYKLIINMLLKYQLSRNGRKRLSSASYKGHFLTCAVEELVLVDDAPFSLPGVINGMSCRRTFDKNTPCSLPALAASLDSEPLVVSSLAWAPLSLLLFGGLGWLETNTAENPENINHLVNILLHLCILPDRR